MRVLFLFFLTGRQINKFSPRTESASLTSWERMCGQRTTKESLFGWFTWEGEEGGGVWVVEWKFECVRER